MHESMVEVRYCFVGRLAGAIYPSSVFRVFPRSLEELYTGTAHGLSGAGEALSVFYTDQGNGVFVRM
jgi:hypothetical protein